MRICVLVHAVRPSRCWWPRAPQADRFYALTPLPRPPRTHRVRDPEHSRGSQLTIPPASWIGANWCSMTRTAGSRSWNTSAGRRRSPNSLGCSGSRHRTAPQRHAWSPIAVSMRGGAAGENPSRCRADVRPARTAMRRSRRTGASSIRSENATRSAASASRRRSRDGIFGRRAGASASCLARSPTAWSRSYRQLISRRPAGELLAPLRAQLEAEVARHGLRARAYPPPAEAVDDREPEASRRHDVRHAAGGPRRT